MPKIAEAETPLWKRTQKSRVADGAGISRQHLNEILARRCRVPKRDMADRLAAAALKVGINIPWKDWMLNTETANPYFSPKVE